jgi:rhodanese-related sulfurtransferase
VPKNVDTGDVRQLIEQGAQLVEVLPPETYAREHLPTAVNVPMDSITLQGVEHLDRDRPVVVYCYDHECDLSARGAHLFEALGFTDVYDYVTSKVAWMAMGLPVEGDTPRSSRAGAIAHPVATCRYDESVGDVDTRLDDPEAVCAVVADGDVVIGVVRPEARRLPPGTPVAGVLRTDQATVRPSITASELAKSMRRDDRPYVLVTLLDGTLVGIVDRDDLNGQH